MLTLSVVILTGSLFWGFMVIAANMMSDAPSQDGISLWPVAGGIMLSLAIFAMWWTGWRLP